MTNAARRRATYQDVLDAPENMIAEIIDGDLHLQPRPAGPHANAASVLTGDLNPAFQRGRGGPGGWFILVEPELHLHADVLVPDLAGWRRERLPEGVSTAHFTVTPDWICEIVSPRTRRIDRTLKMPIYAREGVKHAWLVDPIARTLEVYRLEAGVWIVKALFAEDALVRAEPFDAVELELGALWEGVARDVTE